MSQPQPYYRRFSAAQRIEHWVQVFAFSLLAITGLPQKFTGYPWAENMIAALGSIETVRIFHRYAAIILLIGVIYHGGALTYHLFVKRAPRSMMPTLKDIKDFYQVMAYNFGLKGAWPKMPRYNFEEKIEYWAFAWGTVVMVITGFILWNPIATAKFLPGSFIPAAKAAHGGEALLAVAAILIWHFYGVHLRKFNKSMFTGKMSRQEMEHEHGLELEKIEQDDQPQVSPEAIARRRRVFIPVGTIITIVLLAGVYWFVTFEETAILTVAAATEQGKAYQPFTVAGNSNNHAALTDYTGPETCAECHQEQVDQATASPHHWRVAAAGPNPMLAQLVSANVAVNDTQPDCLLCHAKDYQADNLLASAQSVQAAGGSTCMRCHTSHPQETIHSQAGLACVSCHTSTQHQIQAEVTCTQCHADMPHQEPLINVKHQRLDCRTCHVEAGTEITVNTNESTQNPITKFFEPMLETIAADPQFAWANGATVADENGKIAPLAATTILAPAGFDPVEYAQTGQTSGSLGETNVAFSPSHNITVEQARTCDSCHGPQGSFNFAALGYDEAQANMLSAKVEEEEVSNQ